MMKRLRQVLGSRILEPSRAVVLAQAACYLGAPAILIASVRATVRFAGTPFEIFLGVASGCVLALLITIVGLVMPLTVRPTA